MQFSLRSSLPVLAIALTGAVTFTAGVTGVAGLGEDLRAASAPPAPALTPGEENTITSPATPTGIVVIPVDCDQPGDSRDDAAGVTVPREL